jgi:hypothetical protein
MDRRAVLKASAMDLGAYPQKEGNMYRSGVLLATAVAICLTVINGARADETLRIRAIMHATSVQSQEVGDVDGHVASLARYSGLMSLPDGSIGTTYFTAETDYTKGAGPIVVNYQNFTFNDGSVLWVKTSGTTTVEGTKSVFQGNGTVIGGKGKYDGAKGDVTFSGERLVPLATGADLYNDLVINIKK